MIAWVTVREVAFAKTCSSTESTSGITTQNNVNTGSATGRDNFLDWTRTYSYATQGETRSASSSSTGSTTNQTGFTVSSSSSSSSSYSSSSVENLGKTYENQSVETFVSTLSSSNSYSTQTSYSSTYAVTFSRPTTTTATLLYNAGQTTSETAEVPQWTTVPNSATTTVPDFVQTTVTGSFFDNAAESSTITFTTTTEDGTTMGNVFDTVYLAESNEVLWVVNENPAWSEPLTDNAISTTQTTISASVATVGLVAAVSEQTIEASQSSTVVTVELSQQSSSLITYNAEVAIIDGQTTSSTLTYSSFSSFVSTHVLSAQDQILHYGNTQTAPAVSYDIAQAIQSDALASISWQNSFSVFSTTTKTRSINNTVGTFSTGTGSASGTTSSCYGNTTMQIDVVGGTQKIAAPSQMTVYSPKGVQINNERGGWFTGAGITTSFEDVDMDSTFTSSLEYVFTAKAGDNPQFSTLSPVVPTWFTLSVNSWTSVETATVSGETSTTTVGGVVEVDGEGWTVPVAVRAGIVLGGNLAQSETAVMRLDRGLYKNQDGQTSFFEGDDTTYSGILETTYWYPVSYLEPALGIGVIGVQRNVSTWPSTTAMP